MTTTTAFRTDGSGRTGPGRFHAPDRLKTHAVIALTAFVAYIGARWTDGLLSTALSAFGVSACGWAWLLTRALFDPAPHDARWPRVAAAVLMISGAVSVLAPRDASLAGALSNVANNLYVLSGSAALLMTFVEPFQKHGCDLTRSERRFRIAFVSGFALLVGASVLAAWANPAPVQTLCALASLVAAPAAVAFRLRHPLSISSKTRPEPTADDQRLAERLSRLLRDEAIHADPDLRIGDVADRLGEPEHRLSRSIGGLGFSNFNRLINHHRIEEAKRRLASPDETGSILIIALDSGFASVGPFNRAFKAETGLTPRDWRARQRAEAGSTSADAVHSA